MTILDFTDYAKPIDFKFNENTYRIPAFNKSQIEKLMRINSEFVKKDKDGNLSVPDTDSIDADAEENIKFFDMQDEFIGSALLKKTDNGFVKVQKEELEDWPVKVKNRVMKAISEQMSSTLDEGDVTEKKS